MSEQKVPGIKEFVATVLEMRDFQKSYFQNRLPATLGRAKAAEAKVDKLLEEIRAIVFPKSQK